MLGETKKALRPRWRLDPEKREARKVLEWKELTCGAVLRNVQQGEPLSQRHATKEPSVYQEGPCVRIQAVLSG